MPRSRSTQDRIGNEAKLPDWPARDAHPGASMPTRLLQPETLPYDTKSFRDSVHSSIVAEPFHLRHFDLDDGAAEKSVVVPSNLNALPNAARNERNDPHRQLVAPASAPPPCRSLSLAHKSSSSTSSIDFDASARRYGMMEGVNVAVIGADGVGKSAFIQRALRLPQLPMSNVTSLLQQIDGTSHHVTLIELDLEVFDVDPAHPVQWPRQIGGQMLPRVDGALMLYDVMNKDSIRDLPQTISALSHSSLPTMLVATKCDAPENVRQLDTGGVAAAFPTCIADFKTSANVPQTARECLAAMLRAALAVRNGEKPAASRRRAPSANQRPSTSDNSARHNRASRGMLPTESHRRGLSRSPRRSQGNFTPDDGAGQSVSSMLRTPGVRLDGRKENNFLDVDDSDPDSHCYSDDVPILQRNDEGFDRPTRLTGVTFDELVDRLLAPKMSRADNSFLEIFLCLYRQFARPSQLFSAILVRLERITEDGVSHYLTKTETRLRIIEVVAKWLSQYPGDFARPTTKNMLEDLVSHLSAEPVFAAAAQQMRTDLEWKVVENDDTGWGNADELDEDQAGGKGPHAAPPPAPPPAHADGRRPSGLAESMKSLKLEESRPSQGSQLSLGDREAGRTPAQFQFHSVEDYEREAATMTPTATLPLNKFRYHIFMDIDPDDLADEMTRIDWVMFGSIRIRDLVRHVSLSIEQRTQCRSLKNVNRMIAHFNHVAKWVANMVLIRDKAKHRAPCLEKFMVIAQKLRQLNNYNGLAAVLAGINGAAVHRLAQTRALIAPDVQKRFARLVLLMGTQKSHFAYRLAWENSPLPRIPFIPLHRRDLVSAEEGSRTFVGPRGDRVNWRKFEVLGEVLLPVMRSQGQPYPNLNRHEMSRELILDCRMTIDDEDLYQRSVQVEPTSAVANDTGRKYFGWLVK